MSMDPNLAILPQQKSAEELAKIFPFDEELYALEGEELEFMKNQTGIEDGDEFKKHVIAVTKEAYAAWVRKPFSEPRSPLCVPMIIDPGKGQRRPAMARASGGCTETGRPMRVEGQRKHVNVLPLARELDGVVGRTVFEKGKVKVEARVVPQQVGESVI